MTTTPLELERWVLMASASDSSNQVDNSTQRWDATNRLNAWVLQKQGVSRALLDLLQFSQQETVLFYALTTLQRLDLTQQERIELRTHLMEKSAWLFSTTSTYLKTKVAVVLSRLIRIDFPTPGAWPDAFDQLQRKTTPEMFLRTLDALMEDMAATSTAIAGHHDKDMEANATLIKDAMRGFSSSFHTNSTSLQASPPSSLPVEQTITAQVMEYLVTLLARSYQQVVVTVNGGQQQQQQQDSEQICVLALLVLKRLVSWIDLTLVLQDARVLQLVFGCLNINAPFDKIAIHAVETLQELVGRGMPNDKKLSMLIQMNLLQHLHDSRVNLDVLDATPIEVVIEVAKLINTTGLELLPLWDDRHNDNDDRNEEGPLSTLLQQLLDLFLRCFAYDDIDVSGAVLPLASRWTVTLGKEFKEEKKTQKPSSTTTTTTTPIVVVNGGGNSHPQQQQLFVSNHLPEQLLTIMFRQMKYPPDFEFDYEDEEEAEEEVYRSELRKLNTCLVRICPDLCLQFLCETLSNLPVPLATCPTADIEAALRLVYHYCEGIRPPPGLKTVMRNNDTSFCRVLEALCGNCADVTSHPHHEVLLLYYDIVVRYHPIFKTQPQLLPPVLASLSGDRGLQHSHARVRSRSCYLLLRLVKSIVGSVVMRPYVETAVTGIQGLLSNPNTYPLRPDDTLYLFETIGLLLGKTGLEATEQQQNLTKVMTPHVRSIEEVLRSADLLRDPENFGSILSSSLAAIAYLSKGFTKPPPEVQLVLLETVSITLAVLEALPGNELVRNKSLILIQRMIQCLGNKVLPSMPRFLQLLIENCTAQDVLDVAQLLNQLCLKFKEEAVPAIDAALLPFLCKCHSLMPGDDVVAGGDVPPPHLLTEQLSIKKLTFAFLQYVVTYRATAVLLTATNVNALENVLQTMNEGATTVEDPVMKKSCILFFRELVDQWASEETSPVSKKSPVVQRGFVRYVFEVFVPGMVKCMLDPSFNEQDAMQSRNVTEMGNVLISLKMKRGPEEFERYVIGGLLSSVQCPPNVMEGFRAASNAKEMELCLKEMMKELKRSKRMA